MRFRESVWDDSEPDYAPGLKMIRGTPYWVPPAKCVKLGFSNRTYNLSGDGNVPARCRELMREALRWYYGGDDTSIEPGTWAHLIRRYENDEFSPFQTVAAKTAFEYGKLLRKWDDAIGHLRVKAARFEDLMRWYNAILDADGSLRSQKKPGNYEPRTREAHKMMTMLRTLTSYGIKIEMDGAAKVKGILSECRFSVPPPREVFPTREEADAMITEALNRGLMSAAIGYRMQYDLGLRGNDVIGVWDDGHWEGGVTWNMIDLDAATLQKVIRKTKRTDGKLRTWDLSLAPDLLALLKRVAPDDRIGPVIKSESLGGRPYRPEHWSRVFGRIRDSLGLRKELQARDFRAGAISEADALGASVKDLQRFAGHANPETTQRYMRHDPTGKVMALRKKGDG